MCVCVIPRFVCCCCSAFQRLVALHRVCQGEERGATLSSNDVAGNLSPFVLFRLRTFDRPVVYRAAAQPIGRSLSQHSTTTTTTTASAASSSSNSNPNSNSNGDDGDEEEDDDSDGGDGGDSNSADAPLRISQLPAPSSRLLAEGGALPNAPVLQTYAALVDLVSPPLGFLSLYRGADVQVRVLASFSCGACFVCVCLCLCVCVTCFWGNRRVGKGKLQGGHVRGCGVCESGERVKTICATKCNSSL